MEIKKSKGTDKTLHDYMLVAFGMFIMLMIGIVLTHGVYLRGESDSSSWWGMKVEELVKDEEDDTEAVSGNAASEADADEETSVNQGLEIIPNEDHTVFEVRNYGNKLGEIKTQYSDVALFKKSFDGNDYYIGVTPEGLGGYYLFGGPGELYQADAESVTKIYDGTGKNGFVSDVAGNKLVAVENPAGGNLSIVVYDLAAQKSQSYPVAAPYAVAGEAYLTVSGNKVIYRAALSNPDNEKYVQYLVDLTTGKQTQIDETK